ncbi:MAG: ribosome silencing factor [Clostridia bacterium]|nr:ribosome silencing factor [Clostridia bacterium]
MDDRTLALKAAELLDKKGAMDIEILEVGQLTSITDYFVIATGRNIQAVSTLAEDLEEKLAEEGILPKRRDGMREARWIVLDYTGIIVHIFHPEERKYYNIERLWNDGTNQVAYVPVSERPESQN